MPALQSNLLRVNRKMRTATLRLLIQAFYIIVKLQLAQSVPYYKWILDTFNSPPYQGWGWNHTAILSPYSLLWWGFYWLLTREGFAYFIMLLVLVDVAVRSEERRVGKE